VVASIGRGAFNSTGGDKELTLTLPVAAPQVAEGSWDIQETFTKAVTIKTPAGRTGYDGTWQDNFKKAFGVDYESFTVTINLSFEDLP
jgi:hypothetical protein